MDTSRQVERQSLYRKTVVQNQSVLMTGNRRVGKTWILEHFEKDAKSLHSNRFDVIHYDAQGAPSEDTFFEDIAVLLADLDRDKSIIEKCKSIGPAITTRLKGLIYSKKGSETLYEALTTGNPFEIVRSQLGMLAKNGKPLIILVDEIAIFALRLLNSDKHKLDVFLSRLRMLRQQHKHVRWILTGSIGLNWVAQRGNAAGSLNDLENVVIKPFSAAAGKEFLVNYALSDRVLEPFRFEDEALDWVIHTERICSVWELIKICDTISPTSKAGGLHEASLKDVKNAFSEILRIQHDALYSTWAEHITKNFSPEDARNLRVILSKVAPHKFGISRAQLSLDTNIDLDQVNAALNILLTDGYLVNDPETNNIEFNSGLVRAYWQKYECMSEGNH